MNKKHLIIGVLIIIAMFSRFFFIQGGESILPNFTAIGAIALLGACHLKGAQKFILPLFILWTTDLVLNNVVYAEYFDSFSFVGSFWVYGSFLLIGIVGYFMMKKASWGRLAVTSLAAAVIFYLVTNFGSWLSSPLYTKDFAGLIASYEAGLPFFRNAILGNLIYGFALFGAYEWFAARDNALEPLMNKKSIA